MHQHWQATKRHAQALGLKWTQLQCVDFMENVLQVNPRGLSHVSSGSVDQRIALHKPPP